MFAKQKHIFREKSTKTADASIVYLSILHVIKKNKNRMLKISLVSSCLRSLMYHKRIQFIIILVDTDAKIGEATKGRG